jgi:hypothetical protein
MIAYGLAFMVISLGAILAGRGYVRTSRRMRSFQTTRGRVFKRELATVAGDTREGVWGKGGGYRPAVTYVYTVEGVEHTSDKVSYAHRGLRKSLAEQALAAIPDEVDVFYDPADPDEAYLVRHSPRLGHWLIGGGVLGILFGLLIVLASF